MMEIPTFIVHGRRGDWAATIDGLGSFQVCHSMFLHGGEYGQPCGNSSLNNRRKKLAQMLAIQNDRHVIISHDNWERPPGDPGPGGRHRSGYVGLYEARDANFKNCTLRFKTGALLCRLIRPCDLKRSSSGTRVGAYP